MSLDRARRLNGAIRSMSIHHRTLGSYLLGDIGVHIGQEVVLQGLQEQSPRSNRDLADFAGCEPPTITNSVARLEAAGLVRRTRSADDARVVLVELTDEGRGALDGLDRKWVELAEETAGDLADDEIDDLIGHLEALVERLATARKRRSTHRRIDGDDA